MIDAEAQWEEKAEQEAIAKDDARVAERVLIEALSKPFWKTRIGDILDVSKAIYQAKRAIPFERFREVIEREYGRSLSVISKMEKIGRSKVLNDPANRNRLPSSWVKLYILSCIPEDELQDLIDNGTVNEGIDKRTTLGFRRKDRKKPYTKSEAVERANKITRVIVKVPKGKTLLQLARTGIELEEIEVDTRKVAKRLGLALLTYQHVRDIVLLSQRTDLPAADVTIVRSVMRELEGGNLAVSTLYGRVVHIAQRIWRGRGGGRLMRQRQDRTAEAFKGTMTIIHDTCEAAAAILDPGPLPHLGNADAYIKVIRQLKETQANVRALLKALRDQLNLFREPYGEAVPSNGELK